MIISAFVLLGSEDVYIDLGLEVHVDVQLLLLGPDNPLQLLLLDQLQPKHFSMVFVPFSTPQQSVHEIHRCFHVQLFGQTKHLQSISFV